MNPVQLIKFEQSELEDGDIDSSPPSLPSEQHRHECTVPSDGANGHRDELQLARYEYDALEQRHQKLAARHAELQKLCSAYMEVIGGFSSYEEESASIEQLRVEAGREGLRAKALEANVLKPIIREAGGLQALVSQMQSVRSLIDQVGGLAELEELVSEMHLFRTSLGEIGGLQGLHHLIAEVKRLREQQIARVSMNIKMRAPDGPLAKAAKYDKLVQAFGDIHAVREPSASIETTMINPARASRMVSTPLEDDPYRDLYEPPPMEEARTKTGSNNIPLGPTRVRGQPASQACEQPSLRRDASDEWQNSPNKRPRIDSGPLSIETPQHERQMQAPERDWAQFYPQPSVKVEDFCNTEEQRLPMYGRQPHAITVTTEYTHLSKSVLVGDYPIALWTGASDPSAPELPGQMKKVDHIPKGLGTFLATELSKYITKAAVRFWNEMPPNKDTCVLRYVLDGHRPSGQPQERRACRVCSAAWAGRQRPCALLLDVEGIRTLVFLPLHDGPGRHTDWRKKTYWMDIE
ncbi:hypothetical protein ACJQWK_07086 [Exserohilum turcicum]|uniref:Uncharacterized protein n=1 Tax=Exserohilum turcicum (strain 28A) TaxID=671987 RepID=R0KA51_EXST2|nr:uncharacterized protein SETTUDRAFT_20607 [Exserohilum turcica Et28A]EOA85087.1 hypothetical protein SETTUDRAFT_20607 [Exserohilum turcica Et28A]